MTDDTPAARLRHIALVADALINDRRHQPAQVLARLMTLGAGVIVAPPPNAPAAVLATMCGCIVGDMAQHRALGGRVWLVGPAQLPQLGLPRAALDAAAAKLRVLPLEEGPAPALELPLPPGSTDDELSAILARLQAG